MKIINSKPFYWGVGITCALLFAHSVPDGTVGGGPTGNANMLQNLSFFEKLLTLIPGILLIFYGLFPNSILGKIGKSIYDLYVWVHQENKEK